MATAHASLRAIIRWLAPQWPVYIELAVLCRLPKSRMKYCSYLWLLCEIKVSLCLASALSDLKGCLVRSLVARLIILQVRAGLRSPLPAGSRLSDRISARVDLCSNELVVLARASLCNGPLDRAPHARYHSSHITKEPDTSQPEQHERADENTHTQAPKFTSRARISLALSVTNEPGRLVMVLWLSFFIWSLVTPINQGSLVGAISDLVGGGGRPSSAR